MKKVIILLLTAASPFIFGSCRKCITCYYDAAGVTGSEEYCGTPRYVNGQWTAWEDSYYYSGGYCEYSK
jgi:hypothetical protein